MRLVLTAAERRPVLLAVEDLHWLDPSSVTFSVEIVILPVPWMASRALTHKFARICWICSTTSESHRAPRGFWGASCTPPAADRRLSAEDSAAPPCQVATAFRAWLPPFGCGGAAL